MRILYRPGCIKYVLQQRSSTGTYSSTLGQIVLLLFMYLQIAMHIRLHDKSHSPVTASNAWSIISLITSSCSLAPASTPPSHFLMTPLLPLWRAQNVRLCEFSSFRLLVACFLPQEATKPTSAYCAISPRGVTQYGSCVTSMKMKSRIMSRRWPRQLSTMCAYVAEHFKCARGMTRLMLK